MKLGSDLYIHDSDKAALTALKAIPGFTPFLKAFMKVYSEQQMRITNMSTNLRLGNGQLDKYYEMLPPICEKLGIDVPELYLKLDVVPNAYTSGENEPFIVINSGLLETLPNELIPTVLAHECGHIACHHVLYTTMGRMILSGALNFMSDIVNLVSTPIQIAFAYWMRCSEFSADRAAVICDGTADKVVEMCMRFAGYDKDIVGVGSTELFMEQAEEYRSLIKDSVWNKTLEFLMYNNNDHPLNAVRAYDAREWANTERFHSIQSYLSATDETAELLTPIKIVEKRYIGRKVEDAKEELVKNGFTNLRMERITSGAAKTSPGTVVSMAINGREDFKEDWFNRTSIVTLKYFEPKTIAEISVEHPRDIWLVDGVKPFINIHYEASRQLLKQMGFTNIEKIDIPFPKISIGLKKGNVAKIEINGEPNIAKNSWLKPDSKIVMYCYTEISDDDTKKDGLRILRKKQ